MKCLLGFGECQAHLHVLFLLMPQFFVSRVIFFRYLLYVYSMLYPGESFFCEKYLFRARFLVYLFECCVCARLLNTFGRM